MFIILPPLLYSAPPLLSREVRKHFGGVFWGVKKWPKVAKSGDAFYPLPLNEIVTWISTQLGEMHFIFGSLNDISGAIFEMRDAGITPPSLNGIFGAIVMSLRSKGRYSQ